MAGSFPCCLPQISLGVGALPVFVPSDSCPLSHPSGNLPLVPKEPKLS